MSCWTFIFPASKTWKTGDWANGSSCFHVKEIFPWECKQKVLDCQMLPWDPDFPNTQFYVFLLCRNWQACRNIIPDISCHARGRQAQGDQRQKCDWLFLKIGANKLMEILFLVCMYACTHTSLKQGGGTRYFCTRGLPEKKVKYHWVKDTKLQFKG